MPLFHIHGLVRPVLATLTTGGAVVCTPGFQAPRFFGWLQAHRPTWYTASPTLHRAIVGQAVKQGSTPVPSSLRFIRTSSEAMPPSLVIDIERVFGVPVIGGYGMTETSGQIACNPLPPQVRKPGSVGTAAGPEVAMIDENGLQLGAGQVGEIVVRGPSVMSGYERDPEANAAAFANGWLRTGDQGYRDEEGYIFITGRIKEVINRGGEKIAPREIDDVLLEHSSVAQAVTFGMPDRRLGETVAAAVVLKSGALVTERQLREFVAARIAFFKVPCRIVFLDELPKGPTGKVQRVGLAARLDLSEVGPAAEAMSVQPRTSFERELAQLWTATLGVSDVGVHDDFFELGGTSISAVQVLFEIRRHFGVDLPAAELFRSGTIARLAHKLEEHRRGVSTLVAVASPREVRPMTETERRLAVIWERVLGVRGIGIGDNFFDLGGQSHHVARLVAEIQTVFGEGLPVRALDQEPTIGGLARIIDGTEPSESTLIVPLQADGSGPPLFAIHAGAGYVFFYRALAFRLGPDVPCYAVQAQGHFGRRERPFAPSRSVEQLAARYIREIKTVQPRGAYNLAGASFGGTIAFEMARQLRAEGEKVNSLILLSARVRNNPYITEDAAVLRPSRLDRAAVKGVGGDIAGHLSHLWRLARLSFRPKLEEVRRECVWHWRLLCRRPMPAELINARFMKASRSLMSRYRPDQYDGRIVFFRAATDKDPIPLWTGLALDGIEVYDTPGGHLEMLDEPTVGCVADLIRTHMARADPQAAHLTSAAS
jgi:thioesterase domain-containing protein/acyl carrier protein